MTNPKGRVFERAIATYFQTAGFLTADRMVRHGARDRGDILGIDGWTFECKATQAIALAEAVDEATIEAAHAGTPWYAAIIKRRRMSIGAAYVVMPLSLFVELVKRFAGIASPCRHCGKAA